MLFGNVNVNISNCIERYLLTLKAVTIREFIMEDMTNCYDTDVINNLQTYVKSWASEDLVFTYELNCSWTAFCIKLVLRQKETGFSLSMLMKEYKNHRIVTNFTLEDNKQLESLSLTLYDAANVEIVLQALSLLFVFAEQENIDEVLFLLNKGEMEHLLSFECFFNPLPNFNQVTLNFSTSRHVYDVFVQKTEILKAKIRKELWQRQRDDFYLRNYLQRTMRGDSLNLDVIADDEGQIELKNNVIIFPSRTSKQLLLKEKNAC